MQIISKKTRQILENQKAKWYLGKKVVSKSGAIIGTVKDLMVTEKGIQGYIIGDKFNKTFIDKEFVKEIKIEKTRKFVIILLLWF